MFDNMLRAQGTKDCKTMKQNTLYCGDAVNVLEGFCEGCFDLTVTSPPYENLRDYNGYVFDAKKMLASIYRVTKEGGVCVWVVGDKIKGGRSLVSFEQGLIGKECGFLMHDVMIYQKKNTPFMRSNAYTNCYEFMFVFSKGKPKTFNPLKTPTARNGIEKGVYNKKPDGVNKKRIIELKKEKNRTNIWPYAVGLGGSTSYKEAFAHPAIFPEKLALDHILSWSNKGDTVLDPMCGSGTVCAMAQQQERNWVGIDISADYVKLASKRIETHKKQKYNV